MKTKPKTTVKRARKRTFDDAHDFKGVSVSILKEMDARYKVVRIGKDIVIAEVFEGHRPIELMTEKTFKTIQLNKPYGAERVKAFMAWPERPIFSGGFIFDPSGKVCTKDQLNRWRGFPIPPVKGDWSPLRTHIFENICHSKPDWFNWVMSWLADIIQHPGNKKGTALALKGDLGVGKTKLAQWMRKLLPHNSRSFSKANEVFGEFTGQLEDVLFLVFEEATFAGNPQYYAVQKDMITSDTQNIRHMHLTSYEGPNHIRVMIIGNPDWLVPAGANERRYAVFEVSAEHMQDIPYFAAIDKQMESGGVEAMMYELLHWVQPTDVDLRNPPKTEFLATQQEHSLKGVDAWMLSMVRERRVLKQTMLKENAEVYVTPSEMRDEYRDRVQGTHVKLEQDNVFGKQLAKWGIVMKRRGKKKTPFYEVPSLNDLRAMFEKRYPNMSLTLADAAEDTVKEAAADRDAAAAKQAKEHLDALRRGEAWATEANGGPIN